MKFSRQAGRQAMTSSPAMREAITTLRTERQRVSGELDTIDLALTNLCRLYELDAVTLAEEPAVRSTRRKVVTRRQKPGGRSPKPAAPPAMKAPAPSGVDAAARREQLSALIGKSEVGMTVADLRKATPKMEGQDRSNALQALKMQGAIKRAGNSWVKA